MVHLGQYIPGRSILHRLDPRVKIVAVLLLSIMILNGSALTDGIISLFLIGLVSISRLTLPQVLRALRPVAFFFLLLFLLHLLFTEGTPIPPFPPWPLTPTHEGLLGGIAVTVKFVLLVLSAALLTMTTSPTRLVNGMERLLRPLRVFGVPSHDIATMISIALRFVPTLLEEIDRTKEAQMARGADFKKGHLLKRVRSASSLLIPVLLNAMRRADELATAMEGRGYKGGTRTYMWDLRMSRGDYAAVGVVLVLTLFWIADKYLPIC